MDPEFEIRLEEAAKAQLESYRQAHETQLLVILLTDLVGSTSQQARFGNLRAAELVQEHRRIFRALLATMDGEEVETAGDAFLTVFAAPSEAVLFALRMQRAMRDARTAEPDLPLVRVGIHMGQVVVERYVEGRRAMDLYGLQVSTAARIMDLADGDQILCSRQVFNDARSILRGEQLSGLAPVIWQNHGPYVFKGVESESGVAESYEVCEAGESGYAPLARPAGKPKSYPAEAGDEIFGWRPGPDAVLPRGGWRMAEKLGEGGFGEVWRAQDPAGRETVFKFCTKRSKVRSLRREYEVFNALVRDGKSPPGIVEVIEAHDDAEGDPPYYIRLRYVAGGDLKRWLDRRGKDAPLRIRLELALQMARAVARIHEAGFVHRDLKPSNYLVEPEDDPDRAPALQLCDFGIGHEVMREALTGGTASRALPGGGGQYSVHSESLAQAAGTYVFIAPELLLGGADTPGGISRQALPAADIYSLGVTLFQLFSGDTGRAPGVGLTEVDDAILREDIAACLAGDPAQRPGIAELVERLDRHDIRAREREAEIERTRQRARNRRITAVAAVAGLVALVSVAFGGYALVQRREADRQRNIALENEEMARENARRAEEQGARARWQLYRTLLMQIRAQQEQGLYGLAREFLWQAPIENANWEWGRMALELNPALILLEGHKDDYSGNLVSASFSQDGTRIITAATSDTTARIWDAITGAALAALDAHEFPLSFATFSPDGTRILTASMDGMAYVWDANTGGSVAVLGGHSESVESALFSPDGARVVTSSDDGSVRIWEVTTGTEVAVLRGYAISKCDALGFAIFSPDGARLVTRSIRYATAHIWDVASGTELKTLEGHEDGITSAVFSPDGKHIVTASADNTARVWDAATGEEKAALRGHEEWVLCARFSPDSRHIVTGGGDTLARLWDAVTGEELAVLEGHEQSVTTATFSADGKRILTTSYDGVPRIWDTATGSVISELQGYECQVTCAGFSPDGTRIVTGHADNTACIWNGLAHTETTWLNDYEDDMQSVVLSPNGTRVLTDSFSNLTRIWDANTGAELAMFESAEEGISDATFSPDGAHIATRGLDEKTVRVWDASTCLELFALAGHEETVRCAVFSPDSAYIATASTDKTARIWETATGKELAVLTGHEEAIWSVTFSPDGSRIATTAPREQAVRIWTTETGEELATIRLEDAMVASASFSPDGARVVTTCVNGIAQIQDALSGVELARIGTNQLLWDPEDWYAVYSPDGTVILLAYSGTRTVSTWDADTGAPGVVLESPERGFNTAVFSPDGRRILTASWDMSVRVWDMKTGAQLAVFTGQEDSFRSAQFSADGKRVITLSEDGAFIWNAAPWCLEDLPEVDGVFETLEDERKARFFEWKRRRYAEWVEAHTAAANQ